MDDFYSMLGSGTAAAGQSVEDQIAVNRVTNEANGGWQWDSFFNFLGTGVQHSGQLASVFSPEYRDDQIRLAQQRNDASFFGGINQGSAQSNTSKFILIGIVAVVLIVVIALIMKRK